MSNALREYAKVTAFMVTFIAVVAVAVRMGWEPPSFGGSRRAILKGL